MKEYDIKDFKVESKLHEIWRKAKGKGAEMLKWVGEHPMEASAIASGAAILGKFVKGISRKIDLNKTQQLKDRYVYDRSLGIYLHTKRKLNNKDWVTINQRMKGGERLAEILVKMNLLD